jgi:DNA-binding FrmR family transcriptional regulator
MQASTKKDMLDRLNRIAGQVQGIARMVDEERSPAEVLVQLSSVQAALGKAIQLVLRALTRDELAAALASARPADRNKRVDELMDLIGRYGGVGGR